MEKVLIASKTSIEKVDPGGEGQEEILPLTSWEAAALLSTVAHKLENILVLSRPGFREIYCCWR